MENIIEKLIVFFAGEFLEGSREDLTTETQLLELGIIDSLSLLKTVEFAEEQFGIEIGEQDMLPENFRDIQSICRLVLDKQNNAYEHTVAD